MPLRLIAIQGSLLGQIIPLANPETTIGRDPANTVPFPADSALSRRHLKILRNGDSYTVEDLQSTNGSFLNGARLTGPMPLNHNDEIRIGGQTFRAEAEFTAASQPKRVETPSLETVQAGPYQGVRRKEGLADIMDDFSGCVMPKFNADGCLKTLWYLLIALVVAALIAGIIYLVGMGLGALGAAGSGAGGAGAPGQASGPPPGGQPADPNPPPSEESQTTAGIEILSIRVGYARRDGKTLQPVVLLKWRNTGFEGVNRIQGRVRLYDRSGNLLLTKETQTLYSGPKVPLNEIHEDRLASGGVLITDPLSAPPVSAKVDIERVE